MFGIPGIRNKIDKTVRKGNICKLRDQKVPLKCLPSYLLVLRELEEVVGVEYIWRLQRNLANLFCHDE